MSGHSKWDTIKHKKALNDAKKGKSFSKVSAQISHAAKQGGGDLDMNPTLRMYVDKAKSIGFPAENIEKAIKKGSGDGADGVSFDEISYEGFGPYGIQIIVDALTDNKNRTVSNLRRLFEDIGGNMGATGCVSWNFETKGYIEVLCGHMEKSPKYGDPDIFVADNDEEVMLNIMDIDGVLDIKDFDDDGKKGFMIFTKHDSFGSVRDKLIEFGYVVNDAELIKEAQMLKSLPADEVIKAREALDKLEEDDDIQNVWSDLEEE